MNLGRQIRQTSKRGRLFPATVIENLGNRASVRLAGNGAIVHNLNVVGGPVVAGSRVNVDYSTEPPTILAVGPETMTLGETKDALDQGLLQKPLGGGGGSGPLIVPTIGGNSGGYFGDHRDRLVYGGGPWFGGGSVEFNQAGIRFPWPANGEQGATQHHYFFVDYGLFHLPFWMTGGFRVTPLIRLRPLGGTPETPPTFEIYTEFMEVTQQVDGHWRNGDVLYGQSNGSMPYVNSFRVWTNTEHLKITVDPAGAVSTTDPTYNASTYGEAFDVLTPGLPIMIVTEYWNDDAFNGYGFFIGWFVEPL